MNISELISFLGRNKVLLTINKDQIHYRSPVKIPEDILTSFKENKSYFIEALKRYENRDVLISPLSYNQLSLWFTHFSSPNSKAYNVALPLRILSPVNPDQISFSLNNLLQNHDQLRATFDMISDDSISVPIQIISKNEECQLSVIDTSNMTDNQINKSIEAFCSAPFSLSDIPPFRTVLYSRSSADHILIFLFHHIICDGHSIGTFLNNFLNIYSNHNTNASKPACYTDFVAYQKDYLLQHQDDLLNFWKSKYDPDAVHQLNTDFVRSPVKDHNGCSLFFTLNNDIVQRVTGICRTLSITPFSFYFGCFQLLYMYKSGQLKATIGVLSQGRSSSDLTDTIGYFVNPLPIFCVRSESTSISDHLMRTHKDICEMLDNQYYPFSLLIEKISPDRNNSHVLFSAIFNMLTKKQLGIACDFVYPDSDASEHILGHLQISPYHLNQQEGQFDITVELIERNEYIQGILKYDSDLFTRDSAEKFVSFYNYILNESIDSSKNSITGLLNKLSQKALKIDNNVWHLSIASTFTSSILEESFQYWEHVTGIRIISHFSPYYQIEQSLLVKTDVGPTDYSVYLLRLEDLTYQNDLNTNVDLEYIKKRALDLTDLLMKRAVDMSGQFVVVFCPPSKAVLNNKELNTGLLGVEKLMISELSNVHRFFCVDSEQICQSFGYDTDYEPSVGIIGQVPYTDVFYEKLGVLLIRTIHALNKQPCKAIVVDCDNTLWMGVAGEDSVSQISIPDPIKEFQRFLKSCTERGIPLCLCSKNNRDDVIAVFKNHPDMVLSMSDISFDRINWQQKSLNILEIAQEANLTTGGIVFIDDSPAECAEVNANCKGVSIVELPKAINDRLDYVKNFWAFDNLKITNDDLSRLEKYRQEKSRTVFRNEVSSFAEFIRGLNLQINIRNASTEDIPRISQLSYRTNQFTLGSPKLNEEQVQYCLKQNNSFVVEVTDRFGDYGLVGVIIAQKENNSFIVNHFFLSCRSLGRGVEHKCFSFIGALAEKNDCAIVSIPVHKTSKNEPLQLFMNKFFSSYQTCTDSILFFDIPIDVLEGINFDPAEYEQLSLKFTQNQNALASSTLISFSTELLDKIARTTSNIESLHNQILEFRRNKHSSDNICNISMISTTDKTDTEIVEIIQKIWTESLGNENISVHQNFFDAGGKSIILPHIVQKIQKFLNRSVTIVELFQYPTISSLAAFLTSKPVESIGTSSTSSAMQRQRVDFSKFKPAN